MGAYPAAQPHEAHSEKKCPSCGGGLLPPRNHSRIDKWQAQGPATTIYIHNLHTPWSMLARHAVPLPENLVKAK